MLDKQRLKQKISDNNIKIDDIASKMGINRSTFYRKMNNNSFFIKEVDFISKALSLSKEEAISIFFA